jgi:hypothetical protein
LAKLLIEKGIITQHEFIQKNADARATSTLNESYSTINAAMERCPYKLEILRLVIDGRIQ